LTSLQYLSVQYLRGVAALAVVACHLELQLNRMDFDGAWPRALAGGVDLFFVISGFIMWTTTTDKPISAGEFLRRRLIRVVPLYWAVTTILLLVLLIAPSLLQSARFDALHVIASYLFIPYPSPADGLINPLLVPGWTLNYEMFFYVLFALCLFLQGRGRLVAISVVIGGLVLAGAIARPGNSMLLFWTRPILLEFLFGIAVAIISRKFAAPKWVAWMLIVGGAGLMAVYLLDNPGPNRFVLLGIPAAFVLLGAVWLDRAGAVKSHAGFKLLGDASYSIYLSHGIVLSAASQIWRRVPIPEGPLSWTSFCALALLASVLVGVCLYYGVELRLQRLLRPSSSVQTPKLAG